MMRGQIALGRIFGIRIALHYSWFFIAALITLSLAGHLNTANAAWPATLVWTAAVVTALAFFAALLAHELAHAVVARARGVPVRSITLFALGGMAHMERDAADAPTEFWMGLAGPVTSVAIGAAALGIAAILGWRFDATPETAGMLMLVWFGWINLVLAAFNMIPGFPLDGGRVLRGVIWWVTGNRLRATRVAAGLGRLVAFGFIALGVWMFFRGAGFGGLWLAIIGLFLAESSRAAAAEIEVAESLRGLRVRDVMATDCTAVQRGRPLSEVVEELLRTGRRCFFVVDDGRVAGLVTPQEIRMVERERWPSTPAGEAMRPIDRVHQIRADAPVTDALEMIGREDVNQLPVLVDGRLEGVISRDQIVRVLTARSELTGM
jgi:Zn-dependent protease